MEWFDPFGLVFMTVILIPNIVFALRCGDGSANKYRNKTVSALLFAPAHIFISCQNAKGESDDRIRTAE